MLDPEEFLSDYGIRSVSKYHRDHPYRLTVQGEEKIVNYEPAESQTGIFGGNSKLARPGLVSDQLSADRIAPAVSSLLW